MKTVEELAKEYCDINGYNGYYTRLNLLNAYKDGYNKAKEWIELTDDTSLKEGLYLCKWESGNKNEYPDEIKVRFWSINFNCAYFVDEDCEYDENITHYRFID